MAAGNYEQAQSPSLRHSPALAECFYCSLRHKPSQLLLINCDLQLCTYYRAV